MSETMIDTRIGTKVLIGIPGAEYCRFSEFYDYFNRLDKPTGTAITFVRGQSPARNRNLFFQMALDNDCSHVLCLDDDVTFPADMLLRLMARDKDVVTGLYLKRNFPHEPLIFDKVDDRGYCTYHWQDDSESEALIPIVNCGLGAVLIKTEVLKQMQKPWVRLGELETDHWCDDIGFFNRMRAQVKGVGIFCDMSIRVGHMANVIVKPTFIDGKWMTTYSSGGTGEVNIPCVKPIYPSEEVAEPTSAA